MQTNGNFNAGVSNRMLKYSLRSREFGPEGKRCSMRRSITWERFNSN